MKTYIRPEITVVRLLQKNALLLTSCQSVSTNLADDAINYGGGSSGDARTREQNVWDEGW